MQPSFFQFSDVVDTAAAISAASRTALAPASSSVRIQESTRLLLHTLVHAAPLWVILPHPDRPRTDCLRLADALRTLYAHRSHHDVADDVGDGDNCIHDDNAMNGKLPAQCDGTAPRQVHTESATSPSSAPFSAEEEETRLILALLESHASAPPTGDLDDAKTSQATTTTTATTTAKLDFSQIAMLHGEIDADNKKESNHAPLAGHCFVQKRQHVLQRSLPEVKLISVTLERLVRAPSWYASVLRPACESVLNNTLAMLKPFTRLKTQPSHHHHHHPQQVRRRGEDLAQARAVSWYASHSPSPPEQESTHDSSASTASERQQAATVCIAIAEEAALSHTAFLTAVRRVCADAHSAQRTALKTASGQVVDHRVPLTLPDIHEPLQSRKRGRSAFMGPDPTDIGFTATKTSGLLAWAAELRRDAEGSSATEQDQAGAEGGRHTPSARREAWVEEVMGRMRDGVGCVLLLPKDRTATEDVAGTHKQELRAKSAATFSLLKDRVRESGPGSASVGSGIAALVVMH